MNFLDLIYLFVKYFFLPFFFLIGLIGILTFWIGPIFTKSSEKAFKISVCFLTLFFIYHCFSEISYKRSIKIRNGVLVQKPDYLKHLYDDDGKISNGEYYFYYFQKDLKKVFEIKN